MTNINNIQPEGSCPTDKVTAEQMVERLLKKQQEEKAQQADLLAAQLKAMGFTPEMLQALSGSKAAEPTSTGQKIGQSVAKFVRLVKVATILTKDQSKSFLADIKKGYNEVN